MTTCKNKYDLTLDGVALLERTVGGHMVAPDTLIGVAALVDAGFVNVETDHEGLYAEANESGIMLLKFIHLRLAARALIDDVRARHPGEELRCPHMIALDEALNDAGRAA